ncbi:jacalin-like lectin [Amaricoccus macauensis]|uniref:jacalin-like lectin n=1 Tax=Amaricoccus macauensis TaxID=57001 RepID=UPI003C7D76CA
MTIKTIAIGGSHGADFGIEPVRSIGFRETVNVEAILLNGVRHGDNQGDETETLEFQNDEYIEELVIHEGQSKGENFIRGIKVTTSLGRTLSAGTFDGQVTVIKGARIVGLGGNEGHVLFKLRVRYIENYTPSDIIPGHWIAVIRAIPQGQTFETFTSSRVAKLNASRFFLETVTSIEHTSEASAAFGEFSAKASTTFGLSVTTQNEFSEQVESETINSEKRTYSPPEGHVGLEVVCLDAFRASDGMVWFFPTTEPSIVSAPVSGDAVITRELYDMTGVLPLHLPYMTDLCFRYERFKAARVDRAPQAA